MAAGLSLVCLALVCLPRPGLALILDSGDGLGNSTAPEDDPGWQNVGQHLGSPSVVYLGKRWILTAHHVGASIVILDERRYNPVPGSLVQLVNPDESLADLLVFQIDGDPGVPPLEIATAPARLGENVILIAAGSSRGGRVTMKSESNELIDGFFWNQDQTKRWGTNRVEDRSQFLEHGETRTMAFPILFSRIEDPTGTREEATAGKGDSGGALFAHADPLNPESGWILSGLLFSVSTRTGHPANASFYGDVTWVADLSFYRGQILEHLRQHGTPALGTGMDDPDAGSNEPTPAQLFGGALAACLLILALARRRFRPKAAHTDR